MVNIEEVENEFPELAEDGDLSYFEISSENEDFESENIERIEYVPRKGFNDAGELFVTVNGVEDMYLVTEDKAKDFMRRVIMEDVALEEYNKQIQSAVEDAIDDSVRSVS